MDVDEMAGSKENLMAIHLGKYTVYCEMGWQAAGRVPIGNGIFCNDGYVNIMLKREQA